MKEITFDELRAYIPERFASLSNNKKKRTHDEVYREYNDEKYARLSGAVSFEEATMLYRGPIKDSIFSRHNEFYLASTSEAYTLRESLILKSLRPLLEGAETVIELGAGFGQTLEVIRRAYPSFQYIAGEFSPVARMLGERVAPNITFAPFDFYDTDWNIFNGVQNALVLSFHSIEMVSDASMVADKLKAHTSSIQTMSFFEPIYEEGDLPILEARRRYIETNDYCRNILQSFPDAKVDRDFFGNNPFFPEANLVYKKAPGN